MTLRRSLTKRFFDASKLPSSPSVALDHSPLKSPAKSNPHRECLLTSPGSPALGIFRRLFHRRAVYHSAASRFPELMRLPVGEKLREKLSGISISGERLRLDGNSPTASTPAAEESIYGIAVSDVRKILKLAQTEKVKAKLREIPKTAISYGEFLRICLEGCESEAQGADLARMLDESGNVVVFGNVVFLRPEQVAVTMEALISQSIAKPDDPRRKELEEMEKQKAMIDQRAENLVRGELYCGLGFLLAQTLGFMRLTFWELSWDVMEPICFFVTSLHFALAYGFFLRTSTEPTFQGYFYRRFQVKQKRLMKTHNFDIHKYNTLRTACYYYPHHYNPSAPAKSDPFSPFKRAE